MTFQRTTVAAALGLALLAVSSLAHADVRITEVAPWGSSTANPVIPYASDWFELTNTGTTAVSVAGWTMDDNSNGTGKVALQGISQIAAGESVIFTELAVSASFLSTWFGTQAPAGLQIGTYTGAGVGLSQSGDAVNVYNASGVLQANVVFGAADATSPYQTFDNAAGLNNATISHLSVVGAGGAFVAANHSIEIGSPGAVANAVTAAVPEPASWALLLTAMGVLGGVARRRPR